MHAEAAAIRRVRGEGLGTRAAAASGAQPQSKAWGRANLVLGSRHLCLDKHRLVDDRKVCALRGLQLFCHLRVPPLWGTDAASAPVMPSIVAKDAGRPKRDRRLERTDSNQVLISRIFA